MSSSLLPAPVFILEVPVHPVNMSGALHQVASWIDQPGQFLVTTPNAEIIFQAQQDDELKFALNQAALAPPDSALTLWALRHLGIKVSERVPGIDLMRELCKMAARKEWKVFLLGAAEGVALETGWKLRDRYPGLIVSGCYDGDASAAGDEATLAAIEQRVGRDQIDLLFVAYGAPKQEKWLQRNLPRLPNVKVAMTVGGSFDVLSGRLQRAPRWMRQLGLEWLFRVMQEPSRIKRLGRLWHFYWAVLRDSSPKPKT